MTTNGTAAPATFEGRVEAVNERGIKVDGDWWNVSKFKPVDLPARGALVRITVDFKGFLTSVTELEAAPAATANLSQDATITRLAVLKAAAGFLGELSHTRPEVRSEHVVVLADKWLEWVQQEDADA